ncbi:MAG: hypothetical protein EG822_05460 [Deltaproteobacteria bacterium]|nr:hypothetical protein [Deltaproteobacteria bacterium]TLN04359.1 MAG: hypothetical protein FDZ73_03480 [bacterium]
MQNKCSNYSFKAMIEFVIERVKWAIDTPIFLLYFFGVFIVFGTVGIWYPLAKNGYFITEIIDELYPQNLLSYSMPVLATLLIDAILKIASDKKTNKTLASYGVFIGAVALFFIGYGIMHSEKEFLLVSFIGWLIVVFLWFLFNAGDDKFEDKIDSGAPSAANQPAEAARLSGKGVSGGNDGPN